MLCMLKFFQEFLVGRQIVTLNENAIRNLLVDVDFIEEELSRINQSHLDSLFAEYRLVCLSISIKAPASLICLSRR